MCCRNFVLIHSIVMKSTRQESSKVILPWARVNTKTMSPIFDVNKVVRELEERRP